MNHSEVDHTVGLSGRYAFALFELVQEEGNEENLIKINDQLSMIGDAIRSSEEMQRLIDSPIFSSSEKFSAMQSVLKIFKISEIVENFIGVLCTNKRLFVLPDVIDAYKIFLNQLKGRVNAKVISSSKLTAEQEREIKFILQSRFSKDVEMDIEIDEDILGGLIIKIGSKMIDASLLSRLKSMQSMMNEV